ncbi:MAG TPA: LysR family transcriptional regulator [Caulobacteraceae bacterium]|jgi:DNA-binding transcriptional LysR family regulator|nr:LysR family transcriptional regulator [Caulobacteraceae bacterium]
MRQSAMVELDAVVAVSRWGSFRAAALELGMSPTALSRAVNGLEARLGVRLFNRTTRSVALSEAGEQFISRVAPALSEIRSAMEGVNDFRDKPAGTLRINATVGAGRRILVPVVLEYLRRYPDMRVDLVAEGRLIDIVAEGFDAGVRTRDVAPGDMIAVPFGADQRWVVVGSPAYFEENPPPRTPGDLMRHRCIRARWPSGGLYRWEFARGSEALAIDASGMLTLNDPTLIRDAALAGAGLAYILEAWIAEDLAAGRLVSVLAEWMPSSPSLCLYYPGRRNVPAGLRAFIDVIREIDPPAGPGQRSV